MIEIPGPFHNGLGPFLGWFVAGAVLLIGIGWIVGLVLELRAALADLAVYRELTDKLRKITDDLRAAESAAERRELQLAARRNDFINSSIPK